MKFPGGSEFSARSFSSGGASSTRSWSCRSRASSGAFLPGTAPLERHEVLVVDRARPEVSAKKSNGISRTTRLHRHVERQSVAVRALMTTFEHAIVLEVQRRRGDAGFVAVDDHRRRAGRRQDQRALDAAAEERREGRTESRMRRGSPHLFSKLVKSLDADFKRFQYRGWPRARAAHSRRIRRVQTNGRRRGVRPGRSCASGRDTTRAAEQLRPSAAPPRRA